MTKRKTKGGLNSRKNREKAWALKAAIAEAAARPVQGPIRFERLPREEQCRIRKEERAEEMWTGRLYDRILGPELEPPPRPTANQIARRHLNGLALLAMTLGILSGEEPIL